MCTRAALAGKGRLQSFWNGPGFQTFGVYTRHQELPFTEQRCIRGPPDLLHKAQAGTVQFGYFRADQQLVVQSRRLVITRLAGMHDKQQVLVSQWGLGKPQLPQPLGTSPLHEFQIINVVDDAASIGVLVINATAMCERLNPVLRAHTLVLTPQVANPAGQLFFPFSETFAATE